MSVKCYEVVEVVADAMKEELTPGYAVDTWKALSLRYTCDWIDELALEMETTKYEIAIDEKTGHVFITLTCPDLTVTEKEHAFYEVVSSSESVVFTHGEGDNMKVRFELEGIWSDKRRKAGLIR